MTRTFIAVSVLAIVALVAGCGGGTGSLSTTVSPEASIVSPAGYAGVNLVVVPTGAYGQAFPQNTAGHYAVVPGQWLVPTLKWVRDNLALTTAPVTAKVYEYLVVQGNSVRVGGPLANAFTATATPGVSVIRVRVREAAGKPVLWSADTSVEVSAVDFGRIRFVLVENLVSGPKGEWPLPSGYAYWDTSGFHVKLGCRFSFAERWYATPEMGSYTPPGKTTMTVTLADGTVIRLQNGVYTANAVGAVTFGSWDKLVLPDGRTRTYTETEKIFVFK